VEDSSALDGVAREVRACKKCPLWKTRTKAVPGEGPQDARVVLIGEAPGRNEDAEGRPFVGSAGKKLDAFLAAAKLERSEVFITNVVKCRPPRNRRPKKKEADACHQYLRRQLDSLDPEVTVLLGDTALKRFFPEASLAASHGSVLTLRGSKYLPTYHPASVIYNPRLGTEIAKDLTRLKDTLGRYGLLRALPPEEDSPSQKDEHEGAEQP
jgi:uracil-DNA glycosylase family 4